MWLWLLACGGGEPLPTARVSRADFAPEVSLKGDVRAIDALEVDAPLQGRNTIAFLAEDGARVAAGDKILEIDTTEQEGELTDNHARLELLQTQLEQGLAKQAMKVQDANARIRTTELDTHLSELRISQSEAVPRVERVASQVGAEQAQMDEALARSALQRTHLEAGGEMQLIEVQSADLRAQITKLERDIARATVYAPTDGTVLVRSNWNGKYRTESKVWGGRTILELPDMSKVEVIAWAHEVDSPLLEVGRDVRIKLDADESTIVDGRIERLGAIVETHGEHDLPHLRVNVALLEVPEALKPGMSVTVLVELPGVDDVPWIPQDALFATADGPVVYDAATHAPQRVEVLGEDDGKVALVSLSVPAVLLVDPTVNP